MASSLIEEIRFGYGPRGGTAPLPGGYDADRLMAQLATPDHDDIRWHRPTLAERLALQRQARDDAAARRAGQAVEATAGPALKRITTEDPLTWIPRAATATRGFRERLVNLWANRLTVAFGPAAMAHLVQPFRDEAIRPHVAGRFPDMLAASVFHPAMLVYLDQVRSVGPRSVLGQRRGQGLNENLARELLELHSMGTGYDQRDVTETARLLAGLTAGPDGTAFDPDRAEPGDKRILGTTYGEGEDEIRRLVADIAMRPQTADSVARMLAGHFLSDSPPADLVQAMAAAYLRGEGALPPLYRLMLTHPAARAAELAKIRSPHEYIVATLRALDMTGQEAGVGAIPKVGLRLGEAMARLGQPIHRPRQPDGWPDMAEGWLSVPMLAARLDWAVELARRTPPVDDPGALAERMLGDLAGGPGTAEAVRGAEQRWEGVAVLFAAPAFMRR